MKPSKIKSRAKSCAFRVTMRTEPCGWSNCPSIPFSFLRSSYLRSFHKPENRIHLSSLTSKLLPASDVTIDPLTFKKNEQVTDNVTGTDQERNGFVYAQ